MNLSELVPPIPTLRHFSRATVQVASPQVFGKTPFGERRVVQILAGQLEGELNAEVLPGGADWQILTQDGVSHLEARYTLRTPEGALILVHNRGLRHAPPEVLARLYSGEIVAPSTYYFRSTPTFETADERYSWLNKMICVCSGARTADSVLLDFYRVL
jgi:hypothetical protein